MNTKFNIGDRVYYMASYESDFRWLGTGTVEKITITHPDTVFYSLSTSNKPFSEDSISSDPGVFYDYKIKKAKRGIENLKKQIKQWTEEKAAAVREATEGKKELDS